MPTSPLDFSEAFSKTEVAAIAFRNNTFKMAAIGATTIQLEPTEHGNL
jgi:hypothetical protein